MRGEFVEKNAKKALDYLTFSAERGHPQAQYMLGKMHLDGQEIAQNIEQAQYWLTQSAQQGNSYASAFLERMNEGNFSPSLMLAATRLMNQIGSIFKDNSLPPANPAGPKIEHKQRQKLREKKLA